MENQEQIMFNVGGMKLRTVLLFVSCHEPSEKFADNLRGVTHLT